LQQTDLNINRKFTLKCFVVVCCRNCWTSCTIDQQQLRLDKDFYCGHFDKLISIIL
jgi:hypothetical protein